MLKLGGVVILMQQAFKDIQYLVGDEEILNEASITPTLPIFHDRVLEFLDCLSKNLMHDNVARMYPDVIAYAFWIRRGQMDLAKKKYVDDMYRIGRGVAFQIAPSNIPVQFAVSMTYSLISGNVSLIRISDKEFEQVNIICRIINKLLETSYADIRKYICVIRYGHNDDITKALSNFSDVRMIWGGDGTIDAIRKFPIPTRCIDLGFADRYSIAIIDSSELVLKDIDIIINDFYNDTYFVDQNACSSPRLIIWMGNDIPRAKELFWSALNTLVKKKYKMDPICSSEKLLNIAVFSSGHSNAYVIKDNNLLVRIGINELYSDIMKYKGNCGYFYEYEAENIEEIVPILTKECQTITYLGNLEDKIRSIVIRNGVKGGDRIVPIGHAADISMVWDGIDLPNYLSRQIGDS